MEDGWKWKHIKRSTILYKLLHKFDKLLEKGVFSMSALQNSVKKRTKMRSEHWSQEVRKPRAQGKKLTIKEKQS